MAVIDTGALASDETKPGAAGGATLQGRKLLKTDSVELVRISLCRDTVIPEHKAPGEIIVQCLAGRITVGAEGRTNELAVGQLLHLEAAVPHDVKALEDSTFLVTRLPAN